MQLVRFIARRSPYNPGDQAGFSPDEAAALIRAGIAEAVNGEPREALPVPPEAAPEEQPVETGAEEKALDAPPADRMITAGDAEQKGDQGRRRRGQQSGPRQTGQGDPRGE